MQHTRKRHCRERMLHHAKLYKHSVLMRLPESLVSMLFGYLVECDCAKVLLTTVRFWCKRWTFLTCRLSVDAWFAPLKKRPAQWDLIKRLDISQDNNSFPSGNSWNITWPSTLVSCKILVDKCEPEKIGFGGFWPKTLTSLDIDTTRYRIAPCDFPCTLRSLHIAYDGYMAADVETPSDLFLQLIDFAHLVQLVSLELSGDHFNIVSLPQSLAIFRIFGGYGVNQSQWVNNLTLLPAGLREFSFDRNLFQTWVLPCNLCSLTVPDVFSNNLGLMNRDHEGNIYNGFPKHLQHADIPYPYPNLPTSLLSLRLSRKILAHHNSSFLPFSQLHTLTIYIAEDVVPLIPPNLTSLTLETHDWKDVWNCVQALNSSSLQILRLNVGACMSEVKRDKQMDALLTYIFGQFIRQHCKRLQTVYFEGFLPVYPILRQLDNKHQTRVCLPPWSSIEFLEIGANCGTPPNKLVFLTDHVCFYVACAGCFGRKCESIVLSTDWHYLNVCPVCSRKLLGPECKECKGCRQTACLRSVLFSQNNLIVTPK